MANEITFGFSTGKSLDAAVYAPDGTRREDPDIDLTEIGSTGLYVGSSDSIQTGDLVIIDDGTNKIGWGEYQPEINDADIITEIDANEAKIDTIDTNVDSILTDTETTIPGTITSLQSTADAIETDTQDLQTQIGTDGAGLTNMPWNSDWDTEIQSECKDALDAYDPPTRTELTTDKNSIITEINANETKIDALNDFDPSSDVVAHVTLVDTTTTNTDMVGTDGANTTKTGFKLASDGLDSIATTEPSGKASNFREMIVQVWRRLFGKTELTATQLRSYKADGETVATTQIISETSTKQTQGEAS